MSGEAFWFFAIPTLMLAILVAGAVIAEHVAPRARQSLRRLEAIRAGRQAMARQHAEARQRLDEERRRASEWVAANCYWHQEPRP